MKSAIMMISLALMACSSNSSSNSSTDLQSNAGLDMGMSSGTDGSMSGDGGGSVPVLPACTRPCSQPSDCVIASGGTIYDADNWNCTGSLCQWKGCQSDAECRALSLNNSSVCRLAPGWSDPYSSQYAGCTRTCAKPSDCVIANGGTINDADNWDCQASLCQWKGCQADAECRALYQNNSYVCR